MDNFKWNKLSLPLSKLGIEDSHSIYITRGDSGTIQRINDIEFDGNSIYINVK